MGSARINAVRQRLGAFDFTEPLNKNNELGRRLRRKRIDDTQPHIGRGKPYKRKGRVVSRSPPTVDIFNTFPQEPTKPGTMEEAYQPSYPKPPPFARPKVQVKDRKPGTLFDNEGGLQDREFAADSLDDPSILDPEKWSGEDLKELEDMTATPSLTNYTHKQPLRDKIIQKSLGSVGISDPYPNVMSKQISEEAKYIENPQYKIKPIKPTRMEWRAIISAKSARIQMARERLGAVGKIDWSEIISKQIKPDLEIPSIGAGFLSPKGEYFDLMSSDSRNHDRWLQDILKSTGDKSLMEKYDPYFIGKGHNYQSVAPWLKDSGMMRLRHTNQSSVGIESHSTPTSAQISSLKTYIKDYDLDTDNLLVDDYANSNLETELKLTNRFNAKLRQRIEAI